MYLHLSGLEYLQLVGRLRDLKERPLAHRANQLLALLGLESWRHSQLSAYSKGMKQRVLIAAALLHNPRLLIFDEPLSGLDVVSARLFKDLLLELKSRGRSVLYISHVLEVVEQVCDRVVVLGKGRLLADAAPAELKRAMEHSSLESVFAELVQQTDTRSTARELVTSMEENHA